MNRFKRVVKNPLRRKKNLSAVQRQRDLERNIQLYNARVIDLNTLEETEKARAQRNYESKVLAIAKNAARESHKKERRAENEMNTEIKKIQMRYASKRSDFKRAKAKAEKALSNVKYQTALRNARVRA